MKRVLQVLGVLGVLGVLAGAIALVVALVGVGGAVEQTNREDEQSYFVEHGIEAVGTPVSIEEKPRSSLPRYRGNLREYVLVYAFARDDGSTDQVRGPWRSLEFTLEQELEDGTTATVLYLDDSAEHGDRAGGAVVLDESPD